MGVKGFLKYLFTWWNGSTVGTNLFTFLKGKKVGQDYLGNSYFESKDKEKRWCIYCDQSEASRISPEWNSWLRFISNSIPENNNITPIRHMQSATFCTTTMPSNTVIALLYHSTQYFLP